MKMLFNSLQYRLSQTSPLIRIVVRNFAPKVMPAEVDDGTYKGERPRWTGYEAHHHTKGLLPRLNKKEKVLSTLPITIKEDKWSARNALEGQNDFIRVLGSTDYQQHDLLTHIPDWLRGYRANREYSVLMRRRKEFEHWRHTKPQKWLHLEQRIKFLYRRINNKYKPPDVEKLHRSRYIV